MSSVQAHLDLLGKTARDRVTGAEGVVTSISFDLFGCIQAVVSPPIDKDGKRRDGAWYDVNRLEVVGNKRCMEPPTFAATPTTHAKGPAEKPAR